METKDTTKLKSQLYKEAVKMLLAMFVLAMAILLYIAVRYKTIGTFLKDTKENCQKELPEGYDMVYNKQFDRYAIKYYWCCNEQKYLCFIDGRWTGGYEPYTTFRDSCTAKAFAIDYYEDEEFDKQYNNFK